MFYSPSRRLSSTLSSSSMPVAPVLVLGACERIMLEAVGVVVLVKLYADVAGGTS